ncbi:unnamed protein product [Danaus chrysippus]|uniref:(African queen) hypothetical protein n=1 Tax=Danaus chrysippus TaxID=151541 RepID=A0A8J2WB58_9NEOP|nr:unnamed protein product [Danaus chrysippus]
MLSQVMDVNLSEATRSHRLIEVILNSPGRNTDRNAFARLVSPGRGNNFLITCILTAAVKEPGGQGVGCVGAAARPRRHSTAARSPPPGAVSHLTRCHISERRPARAWSLLACSSHPSPSPSTLRLSQRDTDYRFLVLPDNRLIINATFADTDPLV